MSENNDNSSKNDIKERAAKLASAATDKADDLYNKLPLDKINEKLGGKIDVRSKKVKVAVFIAVCIVFLLVLKGIFGGKNVEEDIDGANPEMATEEMYFEEQGADYGSHENNPPQPMFYCKWCGKLLKAYKT